MELTHYHGNNSLKGVWLWKSMVGYHGNMYMNLHKDIVNYSSGTAQE